VIERFERWRMQPREALDPVFVGNAVADAVERRRKYVNLPRQIGERGQDPDPDTMMRAVRR